MQEKRRSFGCFPLCLTIRSETSGTNQGKMERHFSSKVNFQPDRSVPFTFRPKFRLHHSKMGLETRIFLNGTARFGRTGPTGQKGPPPEVVPNIPVGPNRNGPFHLTSARNFRKFWLKDGAYYCYCAYVLRISRYSDFLSLMLTNTGIFLRGLKLSGESRS